jgi:hypothetical protein
MTNNTFANNTEGLDCVVCADRATGMKNVGKNLNFQVFFSRKTLWSYIM